MRPDFEPRHHEGLMVGVGVEGTAVERSQRAHVEAAMSVARGQVEATSRANRWLWGALAAVGLRLLQLALVDWAPRPGLGAG